MSLEFDRGRPLRLAAAALFALMLVAGGAARAQGESAVGQWQTVDDKTGAPRALIEITQDASGVLSGKVIKGLIPGEPADRRCTACTDARKDQVIIGMTVLSGMHKEGDGWEGGQILDPDNGKVYRCKMHLEKGGSVLVVRGFIGVSLLGRSQTWIRQTPVSAPQHQSP
jgi:uncharacterized protein (DUF2147 family)